MSSFLGIDPGCSGALVLITGQGGYIDHLAMPTIRVGSKSRVNGAAVAAWVRQYGITHAYLENLFPACAPCNLLKTSYSLEMFRKQVSLQVERGRKSSMNFRTAERFGLVEVIEKPVVFWFEQYQEGATA
ncbi:hypothetical protein [Trabulsiella guamensis]|uniref:hypothetical protein n=1 Tax=Trabulsiella guamensis TaxID=158852 RepID=UPI0012EBDF9A|nr:hypothetical protein [Trabulsiella guamensis]